MNMMRVDLVLCTENAFKKGENLFIFMRISDICAMLQIVFLDIFCELVLIPLRMH